MSSTTMERTVNTVCLGKTVATSLLARVGAPVVTGKAKLIQQSAYDIVINVQLATSTLLETSNPPEMPILPCMAGPRALSSNTTSWRTSENTTPAQA